MCVLREPTIPCYRAYDKKACLPARVYLNACVCNCVCVCGLLVGSMRKGVP